LNEKWKAWEEEEEDLNRYWMFSRNREDAGNCKGKHWIAHCH